MFSVQGVLGLAFNLSTQRLTDLDITNLIPTSTRHFENYANDEGSTHVQNNAEGQTLETNVKVQSISEELKWLSCFGHTLFLWWI